MQNYHPTVLEPVALTNRFYLDIVGQVYRIEGTIEEWHESLYGASLYVDLTEFESALQTAYLAGQIFCFIDDDGVITYSNG